MIWEHTASLLQQSPTVPLFPVLSSCAAAVQYSRHQTLVLYSGSDRPPESLHPSVLASDRPPKRFHPSVLVSGQPLVPLTSQVWSSSCPSSRVALHICLPRTHPPGLVRLVRVTRRTSQSDSAHLPCLPFMVSSLCFLDSSVPVSCFWIHLLHSF